jgi:hypothetical protein
MAEQTQAQDDLTQNIVETIQTLERGDTFEARVVTDSGLEMVKKFEVKRFNGIGDINGFATVREMNLGANNDTRRLYLTDDGVSVGHGWSPDGNVVENISLELDTMESPDYALTADKNSDGEIENVELTRTDEPKADTAQTGPTIQ